MVEDEEGIRSMIGRLYRRKESLVKIQITSLVLFFLHIVLSYFPPFKDLLTILMHPEIQIATKSNTKDHHFNLKLS